MVEAERALVAAKDGDLQTLRTLRRTAPFAADGFGASTLHYAARSGKLECVQWLIEAIGISPKVKGKSGATPLHDSAAQGQLECVKYFIGFGGVDAETRDSSGHTALHLAARFGRFESVKWLLEKGNGNARAKSRNHMTPVHFAASGGHLTCLELLIFKAGYSCVNDVATDGTTPLYLATQDGNLDCLKYLHSVGGMCHVQARDGMLPIHGAAQNGHLDCVGYLIESGQAAVNERDTMGATPAHYAASQGHVSVLKWLNAKGDISSVDKLGGTPLHDAAEQGQFECVRYLVENVRLDVNQMDKEGLSAVGLAEKNGHRKCVDYLKIAASKQAKALKRKEDAQSDSQTSKSDDDESAKRSGFTHQSKINKGEKEHAEKGNNTEGSLEHVSSIELTSDLRVGHVPPVKPLRERQKLPLPHFGDILPPPLQFTEDSDTTYEYQEITAVFEERPTVVANTHLQTELLQDNDITNEGDDTQLNESVEQTSGGGGDGIGDVHGGGDGRAEVQTCEDGSDYNDQEEKATDAPVTTSDHVDGVKAAREQPCSDASERVFNKDHRLQGDQSSCEQGWNVLPSWKRQVFVNHMVKENTRKKVEEDTKVIENRKWMDVPKWKIPILAKREEERLKQEQRWIGMPEWKKELIRRRESIHSRSHSLPSNTRAKT